MFFPPSFTGWWLLWWFQGCFGNAGWCYRQVTPPQLTVVWMKGQVFHMNPSTWIFTKEIRPSQVVGVNKISFIWSVVSNIFYFQPEPWGRWTHVDEHIFEMGWNHQLVMVHLGFGGTVWWFPFRILVGFGKVELFVYSSLCWLNDWWMLRYQSPTTIVNLQNHLQNKLESIGSKDWNQMCLGTGSYTGSLKAMLKSKLILFGIKSDRWSSKC